MMVTEKVVVHCTDKDPWLLERAGVALSLATEDNVDKIMTDLEQSQKKVTQLKETLKRESSGSQSLKRKYEDMISEVEVSKAECQTILVDKDDFVLSTSNIEKEAKVTLAYFGKLKQRY